MLVHSCFVSIKSFKLFNISKYWGLTTDSIGSNQYNIGLSRRRAEAVKAKLIEFGLPEDRIVGIEAKGEEYPVATNETAEGRLQNRRVEFRLVQR